MLRELLCVCVLLGLEAKVDENLRYLEQDCGRLENYVRKEPTHRRQETKRWVGRPCHVTGGLSSRDLGAVTFCSGGKLYVVHCMVIVHIGIYCHAV